MSSKTIDTLRVDFKRNRQKAARMKRRLGVCDDTNHATDVKPYDEHLRKLKRSRSQKLTAYNDLNFKVGYDDLFYFHSDMDLTKTERLIEEERYQCRNRRDAERIVSGRALTYQVG